MHVTNGSVRETLFVACFDAGYRARDECPAKAPQKRFKLERGVQARASFVEIPASNFTISK